MVIQWLVVAVLLAGTQAKSLGKAVCPDVCPFIFLPVCGSDAVTYSNQCSLEVAACNYFNTFSNQPDFQPLTIAHDGSCGSRPEKRQFLDHPSGCATVCYMVYAPVCGSNGVTYGNDCMLNSASCMATYNNAEPITMAHQGGCNGEGVISPFLVS